MLHNGDMLQQCVGSRWMRQRGPIGCKICPIDYVTVTGARSASKVDIRQCSMSRQRCILAKTDEVVIYTSFNGWSTGAIRNFVRKYMRYEETWLLLNTWRRWLKYNNHSMKASRFSWATNGIDLDPTVFTQKRESVFTAATDRQGWMNGCMQWRFKNL